jgi:hypothetical protein
VKINDRTQDRTHNTRLLHQLIDSPPNVEPSQVAIVLTHAQEDDRNTSGVHHADERANHVAHGIALGDDETVHSNAVVAELALLYVSVDCRNSKDDRYDIPWCQRTPLRSSWPEQQSRTQRVPRRP